MAFNGSIVVVTPIYKKQGADGSPIQAGIVDVNFAATSYVALGELVLASELDTNLDIIGGMVMLGITDGATVAINCVFDKENDKLILLDLLGVPITDATDVSGVSIRMEYFGW